MSGAARFFDTLRRALESDTRLGYRAALERGALRGRLRVLADRLIQGRA